MAEWNPAKLPFLEEKLKFREKNVDGLDISGNVLCIYAGGETRLTKMYAKKFRNVYAVDKKLPDLPDNVFRFEMEDKEFLKALKNFDDTKLPPVLEILDVDPYGSPMQFLRKFFTEYCGEVRRLILTDGLLTAIKMKRKVNFYKHYGLRPAETIKAKDWHYRHFPALLFSGIKEIVQGAGYTITFFDYEFNRYKTAIYARFDLER